MKEFALRYFKDVAGKPVWFECMTQLGPKFTNQPANAARFASEQEARQSPGFTAGLAPTVVCETPTMSHRDTEELRHSWNECAHKWRTVTDSQFSSENFENVICETCSCPGERDIKTGDVFWPAT